MLRGHRHIKYVWRITITVSVVVMSFFSCKDKNDNLIAFAYDPDTVPTMITTSVSQLISDSGITRYRIVADVWMVFNQAKEPYWHFPEGLYFEQFTPDFEIEATVEADTAWYYNTKDLWRLKKNVHVENRKGEQFDSDELFWDGKNGKVFSEAYIEIQSGLTELKGYGFESNQTMTDYRIFRPHDGKLPFSETTPADSIQSGTGEVSEAENPMPDTD
ncbi:LPS export ABC transporter periplasmic protein LptC [Proteiniphilum sp. X52]|uniref:LPS export ABC transporter periplasmic protein LptC n=1 Tax=Proteiniphilum sp. X52 TaxID=2382159 RepID=UPI000F0A23DC|nr:LPS export ABC transporter periplasmic protein LptC [Proteiniphilum sp. X52]RNC63617.1 LPS export ABC transporter periplasmic protein LptC [Proteiniphilum sp. X52]